MSFRAIAGTGLVLIGAGFMLDQLDLIEFGPLLATWWPLILVAIGVLQLATNSVPVPAGVFVILLGALFQIDRLDILDISLGQLIWPFILIVAGGYMLLSRGGGLTREIADDALDSLVIFGGVERQVTAQSFQSGSAMSLFGGSEIDFRGARLNPDGAVLDVVAAFGGVEVIVPDDWKVNMSGLPIFGAWSNKTRLRDEKSVGAPQLNVRCVAAFGGIDVHN